MSDEPRHVALERQLAAEGWKRCPEDDTAPGSPLAPERAWEHEHPDIWVSVPIDPEHEWYDADCDEVLVAMARARGETWASTLREVERLRETLADAVRTISEAEVALAQSATWDKRLDEVQLAIARHRARQDGGES